MKVEELAEKLGFVQIFQLSNAFCFLSSSVSLFCVSTTALSKSAMLLITVCCDLMRV